MRDLKIEELEQVAGGRGINTGDLAGGDATANGNSVSTGNNSLDASNNASNNHLTVNVDTNNTTVDRLEQKVETYLDRIAGGVL